MSKSNKGDKTDLIHASVYCYLPAKVIRSNADTRVFIAMIKVFIFHGLSIQRLKIFMFT